MTNMLNGNFYVKNEKTRASCGRGALLRAIKYKNEF